MLFVFNLRPHGFGCSSDSDWAHALVAKCTKIRSLPAMVAEPESGAVVNVCERERERGPAAKGKHRHTLIHSNPTTTC